MTPLERDVVEHRPTVLLHLVALADQPGPEEVTAEVMAAEHPELPVDRWAQVLAAMARPDLKSGTRLLYRVAGDRLDGLVAYALGPAGWEAARRLTTGTEAVA